MKRLSLPIVLVLFSLPSLAQAADVLFPKPLHLTRKIEDPVSGTTAVIEQYCQGNRVISVRGTSTSIADFEKGELTQIDRESGTYSITRFDEVAKSSRVIPRSVVAGRERKDLKRVGVRSQAGREVEVFQEKLENGPATAVEVAVDRRIELSREAVEALVGGSYPSQRTDESEIALAAAAPRAGQSRHALPIEQLITYQIDGDRVEQRNTVVRVGDETVPSDLVSIPGGARRVEARAVTMQKELEELDHLPNPPR
jgi:hypothetical protein